MAAELANPSRRVARKMRVLHSHARSFKRKHQRAAKFGRRAGRVAGAAGRAAFPEFARPAAGLKAGFQAARRNPHISCARCGAIIRHRAGDEFYDERKQKMAYTCLKCQRIFDRAIRAAGGQLTRMNPAKASQHYLSLAQKYMNQGAFRSADDAIQRALLAASPGSMEEISAAEMKGKLMQALLDRPMTGPGKLWERTGKNPKVQGAEAVEIVYREANGQLWRHQFKEDRTVPKLRVKKGRTSDKVVISPTRVTQRGIGDPQ